MTNEQEQQKEIMYTIQLPVSGMQIVLNALDELPGKLTRRVTNMIEQQCVQQENQSLEKDTVN